MLQEEIATARAIAEVLDITPLWLMGFDVSERRLYRTMKHEITAKRLRDALEKNGLKPIELSKRTGISKSSISQYCNGVHVPSHTTARAIAEVLDVAPLWLMGFDVSERPESRGEQFDSLWARVSADSQFMAGLEKYLSLSEDKQDILLKLIDVLSDE